MKRSLLQWLIIAVGAVVMLGVPFALGNKPYWLHVAIVAYFYAILASSWALLAGYAGQFSFGHMAFMAVAAYTSGILGHDLGMTPVQSIIIGTLTSAVVGFVIGVLCLRLRSTYLALFTLAFSEILRLALNSELDLTGGPNGLTLELLVDTTSRVPYYYIMLGLLIVSLAFMYWLANSSFGLFFHAIREDEEAAAAMGVNIVRYKIMAFVVTSLIAGLAGAVEAHYIGFITPNILIIAQMSIVVAMAIIGGVESLLGAAIGAIFVQFMLELLREIPMPASIMPTLAQMEGTLEAFGLSVGEHGILTNAWRLVVFGFVLILTLRFYQNGLLYPIIDRLSRRPVLAETVAKRIQATEVES
jgi:branched-chain amino acid transport system permease protein